MSESIQIAVIVLTPFLIIGALLYFTRHSRKLQFYLLIPIVLALTLRTGFASGWRPRDYIDLGLVLVLGISGWLSLPRSQEKKSDENIVV